MSRTNHHRRVRSAREGNPARVLGVDDRAAARKGILTTAARDEGGDPQLTARAAIRGQAWDAPGKRKAYQKAAHRRDRAAVRAALDTTPFRRAPASRQGLRLERALTPSSRRRVDRDIS
ncbi:hypothetical protein [Streptomyces olivaceus]|uniref:hypothetical protein n=1 Tax=Streptomyces olivaceus TaxID=47716 RepID=UPI0022EDAFEA|nr:hypothetical protein [Streptomyces olivaceus]GHI98120.1 hypothetical protein TPA0905_75910 [Streptomyces olivaceus]